VPEPFLRYLRGTAPADRPVPTALLSEVRAALQDARAGRGERRGAFRLLAADAWVTYACEVALLEGEANASLLRVLQAVLAEAEEE
jgi:hypothetical protein